MANDANHINGNGSRLMANGRATHTGYHYEKVKQPTCDEPAIYSTCQRWSKSFTDGKVFVGLIQEDALLALRGLPPDTFNVVVTSPPYFWVRDYGFQGQIGHEDSVSEYINRLADIFDEVKRVLHPEGVFYLNVGDTYYSGNGQPHGHDPACSSRNFMRIRLRPVDRSGWEIPKKSLIGIPWKLAFELQRREWTLRSDIIWERENALSEPSARDRPHRSHEHLFLFSKNRFYSYDRRALGDQGDVWRFPIERSKFIDHNAPFPTGLVRRCIETGSPPGGRILDPFVGSGTALHVALELGRHSIGIDAHPSYIEELSMSLLRSGVKEADWDELTRVLKAKKDSMRDWRGALKNMKKPGSAATRNL